MLYKAINTMDSMFGYKNEQYRQFGSCPARLDDVVNFLPARLSGLALVLAAPLCNCSMKNSWAILRRDRARHTSPNAGWPEAAVAGALGLALGGDSWYFGKLTSKPVLGDQLHHPVPDHILQANRLILAASLLCLFFLTAGYLVLLFLL
jgi:adenosylcobinamide-phosphate synthase